MPKLIIDFKETTTYLNALQVIREAQRSKKTPTEDEAHYLLSDITHGAEITEGNPGEIPSHTPSKFSVLLQCETTDPAELASILHRFAFYPDDYRYDLAKRLQSCKIIDQSAAPYVPNRDTREIIDFSTSFVHLSSRIPWKMPPLPKYIWQKEGDPYPGTAYFAEMDAIRFILNFIQQKEFACQ